MAQTPDPYKKRRQMRLLPSDSPRVLAAKNRNAANSAINVTEQEIERRKRFGRKAK